MIGRIRYALSALRRSWSTYGGDRWQVDEDDAGWISSTTGSGVKVGRKKSYTVSHWFRAINVISSTVAKTAIDVLDVTDGRRVRDRVHPVYRMLGGCNQPNDETLRFHFLQTLTAHAAGHGGGFAYIMRDERARPTELIQLRPDRTYPVRENGRLLYVTSIGGDLGGKGAEARKLLAENVLHIHGLGYDGLSGYSVQLLASEALGSALAKEQFGSKFFRNSATPSVAIQVQKKMSDAGMKSLERSWSTLRSGLENAHKPVILEEGSTVFPFSINANDSQLIEAMERDPVLIANFTGVPPHMLGVKGYSSYNSLEIMSQDLLDYCIDPWFVPWEQELEAKLLTEREKRNETRQVRFRRKDLVRVDYGRRVAGHRAELGGHPWRSVNEVRVEENDDAVEGYDFIPAPLNMGKPGAGAGAADPAEDPTAENPTPAAEANRAAAVRQLVEQTARRMVGRLQKQLERVRGDVDEAAFRSEHRDVITDAFRWLCQMQATRHTAASISTEMIRSALVARKDGKLPEWAESSVSGIVQALCPEKKVDP